MQLFGRQGQKFLHCPGMKGQRDKLKILPRDGTGRDGTGRDGILTGCPVPSRDVPRDKITIYFAYLCRFQRKISKKISKKKFFLANFGHLLAILSRGTSWDRGFCPGTFAPALVPGQRDNGVSHTKAITSLFIFRQRTDVTVLVHSK